MLSPVPITICHIGGRSSHSFPVTTSWQAQARVACQIFSLSLPFCLFKNVAIESKQLACALLTPCFLNSEGGREGGRFGLQAKRLDGSDRRAASFRVQSISGQDASLGNGRLSFTESPFVASSCNRSPRLEQGAGGGVGLSLRIIQFS